MDKGFCFVFVQNWTLMFKTRPHDCCSELREPGCHWIRCLLAFLIAWRLLLVLLSVQHILCHHPVLIATLRKLSHTQTWILLCLVSADGWAHPVTALCMQTFGTENPNFVAWIVGLTPIIYSLHSWDMKQACDSRIGCVFSVHVPWRVKYPGVLENRLAMDCCSLWHVG